MKENCQRTCANAKTNGIMHYVFILCFYGVLSSWPTCATYLESEKQEIGNTKTINQEQTLKLCPSGQVFCPGDGCVEKSASGSCPEGTVFCPQLHQCLLYEDETRISGDYSCPEGQSFCFQRNLCVPDCPSGHPAPLIHHCLAGEVYCPEKGQCIVDCFYVAHKEEMDRLHTCPPEQVYCVVLDQCIPINNGQQPLERNPACPTDMVYCLEMNRCVHFLDPSKLNKNENVTLIRSRRSSQSDAGKGPNTVEKPREASRTSPIQPLYNATEFVQSEFAKLVNSKSKNDTKNIVSNLNWIMQRLCLGLEFDNPSQSNYQYNDKLLFTVRKFSFKNMAEKPVLIGKNPLNNFQIGKQLEEQFSSWKCYPNGTTCPGACLGILQLPLKFIDIALPQTEDEHWTDIVQIMLLHPVTGKNLFNYSSLLKEPVTLRLGVFESTVPEGKDLDCSILFNKRWNFDICTKTKQEIKTEILYIYCACRIIGFFGGFLVPMTSTGETTVTVLPATSTTGRTPEATTTDTTKPSTTTKETTEPLTTTTDTTESSTTVTTTSSTTTAVKDHVVFRSTERKHPSVAALGTSSAMRVTNKPEPPDVKDALERLDELQNEGKPTLLTFTFTIDEEFNNVIQNKKLEFEKNLMSQMAKKLGFTPTIIKNLTLEPEMSPSENHSQIVANNKTRSGDPYPSDEDDGSIKVTFQLEFRSQDHANGKEIHRKLQALINSGNLDLKDLDNQDLTIRPHGVGVKVEPIEITEDQSVNVAIIVGIVLGLLLIILVLIGVAVYMKMKKQKEKIQPFLRLTPNLHPTYKSFHHENTLDGTIESLVRIRKRAENFAPTAPPMDSGTWRLPYGAAPPAATRQHRHLHPKSSAPTKVHVQAPLLSSSRGGNLILMQTFNGKPVSASLPGSLTSMDNEDSKNNKEPNAKDFYY